MKFDDAGTFEREVDLFISKGALRLRGDGLPAPLVPFDFALAPPGGAPVKLRGMIVSSGGGLALVQILDFSQALAGDLRRATTRPPTLAVHDDLESVAPSPGAAPPAATPLLVTAVGSIPPRGAPAGTLPPPEERAAARSPSTPPASGRPGSKPPGLVDAFDAPIEWSTPGPAQTGVFAVAAPAAGSALSGRLENPVGAAALAALPLGAVAAVRDLSAVSTVGLVRFLGARRASGELVLRGDAGGERRVAIDRGAFLLSPQERDAIRVAFQWKAGTYAFEPRAPQRPPHRLPVSAWRLVLDAIKLLIRDAAPDELSRLVDPTRGVRLTAAFAERSRHLDLHANEERVVKRDFDGRLSLCEIIKLGALSELNLLRIVYLLQILGLVELTAPTGAAAAAVDEVRESYERLLGSDLFKALGVHWSDPPSKIDAGLADMRRRYGPGSPGAAASPEYAARLVELAERAYRRLKDRSGRRAHRDELAVDVRHAAELLAQQVPIARARGELVKAHDLIAAACDLVDRPEWERLRQEIASLLPSRSPAS